MSDYSCNWFYGAWKELERRKAEAARWERFPWDYGPNSAAQRAYDAAAAKNPPPLDEALIERITRHVIDRSKEKP